MKLIYRGVHYEYNPPFVGTEPNGIVGKYRGLEWKFRNPTKVALLRPNLDLMYRGIPYTTSQAQTSSAGDIDVRTPKTAVAAQGTARPASSCVGVQELVRESMVAHLKLMKKRQQSLLKRAAAEVGLGAA